MGQPSRGSQQLFAVLLLFKERGKTKPDQVDVGLVTMKTFFLPFLVMWFLSAGPPHHLRPLSLPSSLLLSFFSSQNLAEITLFESEYGSSTGPNTKLEPLHCVSSYV